MIQREFTAERINAVLNAPDVRPYVANSEDGVLDVSAAVANDRNVLLMGEHGGIMFFELVNPGVYECHTQVRRAGRGEWAALLIEACAHWMFTRTPAYEIVTRVPAGHVAARVATIAAGMSYEFTRPGGARYRDRTVDVDLFGYRVQDWVKKAPGLVEAGRVMHEQLHAEAARLGIEAPPHDDDENHNRYLGAALAMARGGQVVKGATMYNRWAQMARHRTIQLVSVDPCVVRFDIGLLRIDADRVEIIQAC